MTIGEEALQLYPKKEKQNKKGTGTYDPNFSRINAYIEGANYVLEQIENLTDNQNWCAFPKQSHKELKELIEQLKNKAMKCKDCNVVGCVYRTSDAVKECEFQSHTIQVPDEWQYVRIQASIAAMQGVMNFFGSIDYNRETIARLAVEQADALIEELKKK